MLAEENKSAGPSALDGKPAEIFFLLHPKFLFPGFLVHPYAFLTMLFILRLSNLIGLMLEHTPYGNVMKIKKDKGFLGVCYSNQVLGICLCF